MGKSNKNHSIFSKVSKNAIAVKKELTDGEVIWRKRADGSGTWRYDFCLAGQRGFTILDLHHLQGRPVPEETGDKGTLRTWV